MIVHKEMTDEEKFEHRGYSLQTNLFRCNSPSDLRHYFFESTHFLKDDVEMLYDKYFKSMVNNIKKGTLNKKEGKDFKLITISSDDFKNKASIEAHNINPIKINIGVFYNGNNYLPLKSEINLSLHFEVVDVFLYNSEQKELIESEGTEDLKRYNITLSSMSIHGSIYHELSHWVNDSLHNSHLYKKIKKAKSKKDIMKHVYDDKSSPLLSKVEIDAQIHSMLILYDLYKKEWESFTLIDIFRKFPSLIVPFQHLYNNYNKDKKQFYLYQKDFFKRLDRENLLGRNMKPMSIKDLGKYLKK